MVCSLLFAQDLLTNSNRSADLSGSPSFNRSLEITNENTEPLSSNFNNVPGQIKSHAGRNWAAAGLSAILARFERKVVTVGLLGLQRIVR